MYQEQRLKEILSLVSRKGQLSAKEAMTHLQVSRDTIRRDFSKLAQRGLARRTHGGLIPAPKSQTIPSFSDRLKDLTQEKSRMADLAKSFIKDGDHVFLDVSTTILKLAQVIDKQATLYSHSLDNAIMLSQKQHSSFHLIGGKFFPKNRFYFSLNEAQLLKNINLDVAFIGAAGLANGQVAFDDQEDCMVKKLILQQAKTKILIAEGTKFAQSAPHILTTASDFDYFITDKKPNQTIKTLLGQQITIIY